MKFFGTVILLCVLLGLGGFIFMTQWEVQVPEQQVTKTIDNDRFFETATTGLQ